jgi:hypothetical protein
MQKYGFVYLWYDRKRKMYYVGCHWGTEDDGYVCSSPRMKSCYKRNPSIFKRRILARVYTTRADLFAEEYRWLSMIKENELNTKYYNKHQHHPNHWSVNELDETRLKLRGGHWSKKEASNLVSKKISEANKGRSPPNKGIPWTDSQRETYITAFKTKKKRKIPQEQIDRLIAACHDLRRRGIHGMKGKKHATETLRLMSENNGMKNEEYRKKVKEAKKGIKWMSNGSVKKMAVPGTEKYNDLIRQGFTVIPPFRTPKLINNPDHIPKELNETNHLFQKATT